MRPTDAERARRLAFVWQGLAVFAGAVLGQAVAAEVLHVKGPARHVGTAVGLLVGLGIAWLIHLHRTRRPGAAAPRPGTRAFEAFHNVALIERMIADRRVEQARTQDPARRGLLERELHHLEAQLATNRATLAANDLSPGVGHIGVDPFPG